MSCLFMNEWLPVQLASQFCCHLCRYTLLCWLHALAYCLCPQLSWLLLSCTIAVINVYMCVHITNTYWYTLDVYIIRSCDVYISYIAADYSCGRMGKIFWAVVCVEAASHEHMEVRPWLAGVLKHHPGGRASPAGGRIADRAGHI